MVVGPAGINTQRPRLSDRHLPRTGVSLDRHGGGGCSCCYCRALLDRRGCGWNTVCHDVSTHKDRTMTMELAKAIILLRWYKVKVVIVQWYVVGYHISSERVRLVISYRYHMAFLPFSDLHVKATCRLTFTATASSCHIQLDAD